MTFWIIAGSLLLLWILRVKTRKMSMLGQAAWLHCQTFPEQWRISTDTLYTQNYSSFNCRSKENTVYFNFDYEAWESPFAFLFTVPCNDYRVPRWEAKRVYKFIKKYQAERCTINGRQYSKEILDAVLKEAQAELRKRTNV